MKIAIVSDVHGNVSAMEAVLNVIDNNHCEACISLGDLINYGMHSNEIISLMQTVQLKILCNIHGNHEHAIVNGEYDRFSSERGKACAQYTKSILSDTAWDYIMNTMLNDGMYEFECEGNQCLAVHGSLSDIYWKNIRPGQDLSAYQKYDYVFSGHSHLPHFFEEFYETNNPTYRNKKKTIFINPGSVGQPRNHNPMAQFAILDMQTGQVTMEKVPYDIEKEQEAYNGQVDEFYKTRLERGI